MRFLAGYDGCKDPAYREYRFAEIRHPGVYYVRLKTDVIQAPHTRKVVLL